MSLNSTWSLLDWGMIEWIRDSREEDEALADIRVVKRKARSDAAP
jgi:hypothetical protein